MQVTLKLFATLTRFLPETAVKNIVKLEVEEGTTANDLIQRFQLPEKEVHLVLLTGVYLYESDRLKPLNKDATLAIWPPVAGG